MKKIFISYATKDVNKLKALSRAIDNEKGLDKIIVADKSNPGKPLSDKVKECIEEADYLLPIITRASITNQWVNQEIGYATAKKKEIIPLVEARYISKLKGFIHNQLDLPFTFEGFKSNSKIEASRFRKCYISALIYLESLSVKTEDEAAPTEPKLKEQLRDIRLEIVEPKTDFASGEYVDISGVGAPPGSAIIIVTSLDGKYLAPQLGYATADKDGNWKYEKCHLLHVERHRLLYAIAVNIRHEYKVRELLRNKGKKPVENAMKNFEKFLKAKKIPYHISFKRTLIRKNKRI